MSIGFFIVGGIIFSVYMYFTVLNIFYSNKKQRVENYPNWGSEGCNSADNLKKEEEEVNINAYF